MKLNLRDLFWLTLLIAMALGWWQDHRRQRASARRISEMLLKAVETEVIPTEIVATNPEPVSFP